MSAIERVVYAIVFFVGWMSGGGIMAMLVLAALIAVGAPIANEFFVLGCLWGSWGVVIGRLMGRHYLNNTPQQHGGRAE